MIILLDLDGTLTDTAHEKFKPFKDGLQETIVSQIPFFPRAKEFIEAIKGLGHQPIIVSDSHPKYVNKIARNIDVPAVCLCDKPNPDVVLSYINNNSTLSALFQDRDNYIMIGDSWLDIELGRRLNIRTVLTSFYNATTIEQRDGIGQEWKPIKMGPTYCAKNFDELKAIIEKPLENLLAIEAIFKGQDSGRMQKFHDKRTRERFIAFRCLARQEDGECDKYARADQYFQIDNPGRTPEFLSKLARAATNSLENITSFNRYHWDFVTYVSDKRTTTPPNKMKEIFDLIQTDVEKIHLFEWSQNVEGSLRNKPDYRSRRNFISANLKTNDTVDLAGKNIIVFDDQFTSSATAHEISNQLVRKGAGNILFIALFYLVSAIESKDCSCGQPMKIKIRKRDGHKFYSCVPPNYGGQGCGRIENIAS